MAGRRSELETSLLSTKNLRKSFGGLMAVLDVNFQVEAGEIMAVIGPNGAGKSTIFNLVSGLLRPTSGEIRLEGRLVNDLAPHAIARLGLARTFQNLQLFGNMTVLENVMVGRHSRASYGLLEAAFRLPRAQRQERLIYQQAMAGLDRVGLASRAHQSAASLPFGQQRLLEIARALATEPKLLLLDEPGSGLNHTEKDALHDLIQDIRADGITVLLVEHDVQFVMSIADRVMVLDYGQKIAEGTPAQVQADDRVIAAYLGDEGI